MQSNDNGFGVTIITGFENVIGTDQNDFIIGNDQANILDGGSGADMIDGGAGIDVVRFDPTSGSVRIDLPLLDPAFGNIRRSGSGGDAEGDTYDNVEVFIGTDASDKFIGGGVFGTTAPLMIAGGSGNDRYELGLSTLPTVFWGGSGADSIVGANRVMVVDVPNLTEVNFHLFSLDLINVGPNFDWSVIDVVLLNPDSSDRLVTFDDNQDEYNRSAGMQTFTFAGGGEGTPPL